MDYVYYAWIISRAISSLLWVLPRAFSSMHSLFFNWGQAGEVGWGAPVDRDLLVFSYVCTLRLLYVCASGPYGWRRGPLQSKPEDHYHDPPLTLGSDLE